MDIVYRKSTGQIVALFPTHGVKQNVMGDLDYIAIETNLTPQDISVNYYLKGKKLTKKEVLDIYFVGDIIVVQKKDQEGNKIETGNDTFRLEISRSLNPEEVDANPLLDRNVFNDNVQLTNGKFEFAIQRIEDADLRSKIEDINIDCPRYLCKAMRKKDYGITKVVKGRLRKVKSGFKTWRQLP